jgi:hexokinase
LINDTTGCLLACAYKRPDCAIAVILGTGTNASYVEDMNFVEMYEGEKPERRPAVIINTEWGAFGNTGSLDNVRTEYDFQLDKNSRNPSKQVYEKLISGMYLGELVRLVIVRAVEAGVIFDGVEQKPLLIKENFPTRWVMRCFFCHGRRRRRT